VDVIATHSGKRYGTRMRSRARLRRLLIGHTLPAGAKVARVTLDGRAAGYRTRATNRGLELTVRVRTPNRRHKLVVRIR
jgi:hypothetical protein